MPRTMKFDATDIMSVTSNHIDLQRAPFGEQCTAHTSVAQERTLELIFSIQASLKKARTAGPSFQIMGQEM